MIVDRLAQRVNIEQTETRSLLTSRNLNSDPLPGNCNTLQMEAISAVLDSALTWSGLGARARAGVPDHPMQRDAAVVSDNDGPLGLQVVSSTPNVIRTRDN